MPELPELEVVTEVLRRRVAGQTIAAVEVAASGGIVMRDLTHKGFESSLLGASFDDPVRRGKFLRLPLTGAGESTGLEIVINPKLTGRLQLAAPQDKRFAKTHLVLTLSSGQQLRYIDQKQMGQIYLTTDLAIVPGYAELGPEPFDITLDTFDSRLQPYRGEVKGILTRGEFIAGIGNAYADEILWTARLNPFRKRTQLSQEEIRRLYEGMRSTLLAAIEHIRADMGEQIHREPRAFMAVHMKTAEPCPRCGSPIALVGANQRITNFCRTCQPGGLIKGM